MRPYILVGFVGAAAGSADCGGEREDGERAKDSQCESLRNHTGSEALRRFARGPRLI